MLNGVNQSSFRSFRGFKENICARFFLQPIWELRAHPRPCKDAANTSSVLRRRLLSLTVCKHIIQSQTCPLLPAFLSLFRSLPFKIWLKLSFLWACDLFQRRPVALFFEGTSGQNAACGEFCRRRRRNLNDKKGSISEKGFPWQKYLQKGFWWPKYLPSFKYEMRNCGKCTRLEREWGSGEREDLLSEIFSQLRIWRTAELG